MTILCICSSSLNDTIPLNSIYHNFLTTTSKDLLNIDLISTDSSIPSTIFLGGNVIRNQLFFSFTKSFYDSFIEINIIDYDLVINIASNFKSELIFKLLKTKNKIRVPFNFLTLFKKAPKWYKKELSDQKTRQLQDQLQHYGISKNLEPVININKNIYAKTFEMVNWFLKSANKQLLTNNNFCFIYFNELYQFDTKEKWVEEILVSLLENNVQVIPVFNYNFQDFSHRNRALLIDNFAQNNDSNYIYLFLKYSKFVITNDESLKIACNLSKKTYVYYNFDDQELIVQDVIKDINFLIN
jgi:hypothetical protein|tara:strand:+ start:37 stop:930 length:894 start_codon:yes stop_codon:yes gene_type:complete